MILLESERSVRPSVLVWVIAIVILFTVALFLAGCKVDDFALRMKNADFLHHAGTTVVTNAVELPPLVR